MKRLMLILPLILAMLAPTFAMAAETIKVGSGVAAAGDDAGTLTRRQRRKLGITFRNIRRVASDLKKAGELSDDKAVAAAQVLQALTQENPKAFQQEAGSIDWDALLDFIERLLELILKFLPLFVSNGVPVYHVAA